MNQFINIITKTWGVWKQKIEIIVNKKSKTSIEDEVIVEAMDGMKIVGEIEMLSPYYYRYDVNFIGAIVQLVAIGLAILLTAYKVVRLFLEISFAKILAPFVASVDLSTGQRMKQLVKDILMNYGALALIPLVMKLYIFAMTWLANKDFNWVTDKSVVEVIQGTRTIESALEEMQKTWDVSAQAFNPVTGVGIQ